MPQNIPKIHDASREAQEKWQKLLKNTQNISKKIPKFAEGTLKSYKQKNMRIAKKSK